MNQIHPSPAEQERRRLAGLYGETCFDPKPVVSRNMEPARLIVEFAENAMRGRITQRLTGVSERYALARQTDRIRSLIWC